jgi:pimeloyl-ACP methyl ester carboxylesterase
MSLSDSNSTTPDSLWVNVSAGFQCLDRKLLGQLTRYSEVSHWAYSQTVDEPCSLDIAVTLLHDYVKRCDRPLHLMGHSTGGLVALLYARQFPHRVKSLVLLGVGVNPAVDWQAHYYAQLGFLHCKRSLVLAQMAYALFGKRPQPAVRRFVYMLEQDLVHSLSPHSLYKRVSIGPEEVPVPLMVCGGSEDTLVDPTQIEGWRPWLKPEDRLWLCPGGKYFFQASHYQMVAHQILNFWGITSELTITPPPSELVSLGDVA